MSPIEETRGGNKARNPKHESSLAQANAGLGRPVPESLTVTDLKRAGALLKIAALATLAGLPAQTLHSKMRRGGSLTPEECAAIHNALAGVNLAVAK